MKRRILAGIITAVTAFAVMPAHAGPISPADGVERYTPAAAGQEKTLKYVFGPYVVPPGQDSNRITLDVPLTTGFITAVAPNLIDTATGEEVDERVGHIHHAHWLRVTTDPAYEPYSAGLSWVFGTGEEKTQGGLDDRSAIDPTGPRYGIFVDGTTPQALIYMIHNKTSSAISAYVTLDVKFIYGTAAEVTASDPAHPMHPLTGILWGETKDATSLYPRLTSRKTMSSDGVAVASGGHLHPGGKGVIVANLGPNGTCADLDNDGYPGTTILNSHKYDRVAAAFPYSEEYQMGATKFGWRSPIHKGDVLQQFAPYDVDNPATPQVDTIDGLKHAWFQAMTYTGIYVDRLASTTPSACTLANYQPKLIGADNVSVQGKDIEAARYPVGVTEGIINHNWQTEAVEPLCGLSGYGACENRGNVNSARGQYTDAIHTAGFLYLPGDQSLAGDLGALPLVHKGTQLKFINEDAGVNARHTFTSCLAPCKGEYVGNYPIPDALFDSGKLGNLDPIDGGLTGADTVPLYTLNTSTMNTGVYTYFCRIHPFMRGAFEVTT